MANISASMAANMVMLLLIVISISIPGIQCEEKEQPEQKHNTHHPCCYTSHCIREYYDGYQWRLQKGYCESQHYKQGSEAEKNNKHRPGGQGSGWGSSSSSHYSNSNNHDHSYCYYDGCLYTGACYYDHNEHWKSNGTSTEDLLKGSPIPEEKKTEG